jgi:hypothetical protein
MTRYGNLGAFDDDELASLRPISSGGNRVITPSKNFSQNRSGSNPRSSSATKDSRALFKAIHEIDTAVRASSRATSRFTSDCLTVNLGIDDYISSMNILSSMINKNLKLGGKIDDLKMIICWAFAGF